MLRWSPLILAFLVVVVVVAEALPIKTVGAAAQTPPGDAATTPPATAPATAPAAKTVGPARRLVNDMCPVLVDEFASPQHEVSFRGVVVRLCCRTCREKFEANPERYLDRLPHVPPTVAPAPQVPDERGLADRLLGEWWEPVNRTWREYEPAYLRWRPLLVAALAVLVVQLLAGRALRARRPKGASANSATMATTVASSGSPAEGGRETPKRGRLLGALARPVTILLALQTLVIIGVAREALRSHHLAGAERAARESQEVVAKGGGVFAAELSRQAVLQGDQRVRQLGGTYFRGNDERDPRLFNGGIYETCRFETSIRDEAGGQIRPGDDVAGKQLSVRVEIVRAPHTIDSLMSDESMSWVFLAGRTIDPWLSTPKDLSLPVRFRSVEPNQRWVAEYPIGRAVGGKGIQKLEGVVLLCRGEPSPEHGASTAAHYGIEYHLRIENGRVVPNASRFWMAALYFTSDLPDDRVWEWFSPDPLPPIPDGYEPDPTLERDDEPPAGPHTQPISRASPSPTI